MIYYLAFFFTAATFVIINPYLQVVLSNLGFGFEAVGMLQALFGAFGILGPMVLGYVANKKGWYKGLIIFALFVSCVCFYFLSLSNSTFLVVILLILTGFVFKATAPLLDSIVNVAVEGNSSKYTTIRSGGTLGFVAASAFLSFIGRPIIGSNKNIAFWFIVLSLFSIVVMFFVPKQEKVEPLVKKTNIKKEQNWFNRGLVIGFVLMGLSHFSMSSVISFLSLYSIEVVGYHNLTALNLVSSGSEFFAMLYSGYLLQNQKVRPIQLIIFGTFAVTVRLMIYAFLPSVPFLFFAQALHSLTFGAVHVAAIMFINQHVRYDKRGLGISLYYSLSIGLPNVIGSSIGGVVVASFGFKALFISYGLVSLFAALMGFIFYKQLNEGFVS